MDLERYSTIKKEHKPDFDERKKTLFKRIAPDHNNAGLKTMEQIPWFRDWIPMWSAPNNGDEDYLLSLIAWQFPHARIELLTFIKENFERLIKEAGNGPVNRYRKGPRALAAEIMLAYATGSWRNSTPKTNFIGETAVLEFTLIGIHAINSIRKTVRDTWGQKNFVIKNDHIDPISLAVEAVTEYLTPDPASKRSIASWNPKDTLLIDHFLTAICGTASYQTPKAKQLAAGYYCDILARYDLLVYFSQYAEMVFPDGRRLDYDPEGHDRTDWMITAQAKFKVPYNKNEVTAQNNNEDEEKFPSRLYPTDHITENGEKLFFQHAGNIGIHVPAHGLREFIKCKHCSASETVIYTGKWDTPLQRAKKLGKIYYESEWPLPAPELTREQARQLIQENQNLHCPYCGNSPERARNTLLGVKLKYSNAVEQTNPP